jgi:hypothetical protein
MKLEAMELVLQIMHGLTVRRHLWIHTVFVLHHLIYNQIRVSPDLEAFDPELNGDSEAVDQGFIHGGVVRCREM